MKTHESLGTAEGACNTEQLLWKTTQQFLHKFLPYGSAITLLVIYPKVVEKFVHEKLAQRCLQHLYS